MPRALLVEVAGEAIAIPADGQRCEVLEASSVTGLPIAAPLLLGLTVIHGRAVPLVNLVHHLGAPPRPSSPTEGSLTVLTEVHGESLALPADRTLGLITLPETSAGPGSEVLGTPVTLPAPDGSGPLSVRSLNPQALFIGLRRHLERV